jgi:tryptophan synthase beta chain
MGLLGAEVRGVDFGTQTLKEATSEAIRDWITNVETTHYLIGSCVGPAPYPELVAELQSVIGREARAQMHEQFGRLPDALVACVGGGSNAIGLFHAFLNDRDVAIFGAEAAGEGIASGKHAASLAAGRPGVLHGNRTYVLCDDDGQITETHSVSAGLDYPGVGPEHAFLKDSGRARYVGVTDDEALAAFHELARTEGILAALESSHAVAQAVKLARGMSSDRMILVNLSGRGDKDVHTIAAREGIVL